MMAANAHRKVVLVVTKVVVCLDWEINPKEHHSEEVCR